VLLALFAVTMFVTWPQTLGGRIAYVMVSGHSMEPTMHLGDLAVIRSGSSYHRGEIVAYRVPKGQVGEGALVIHRIVGGDARRGFVTRGDNNDYVDPWRPHPGDIVGTRFALLPRAASLFERLRGPLPLAGFAAVAAVVAVTTTSSGGRRRRRRVGGGRRAVVGA
jgi:signal peptidase